MIGNDGSTSKSSHSVNTKETNKNRQRHAGSERPVKMGRNTPIIWRLMCIEMKSPPKSCFQFKKLYNSSSNAASQELCLALFLD